jgi:basic membrane lipoprotein Med (substrate-binding protein (PBP1-ABC) superfamily)
MAGAAAAAVLLVTGCGSSPKRSETVRSAPAAPAARLRIGIVGPLQVQVRGAAVEHGTLAHVAEDQLVLVDSSTVGAARLADAADAHPATHFALIGASTKGHRRPNLAGIVLRDDQAALLAGAVAGLVAAEESVPEPRVAWVGPREESLVTTFVRGVHATSPKAAILREWSGDTPVACKEAAIAAIERDAIAVAAHGGGCAEAAAAGAHDQGRVALALSGFQLPNVAALRIARDALAGVYYGREDVIFGARAGVIGVRRLDPRVPPSIAVQAHLAAQELASGRTPSG